MCFFFLCVSIFQQSLFVLFRIFDGRRRDYSLNVVCNYIIVEIVVERIFSYKFLNWTTMRNAHSCFVISEFRSLEKRSFDFQEAVSLCLGKEFETFIYYYQHPVC